MNIFKKKFITIKLNVYLYNFNCWLRKCYNINRDEFFYYMLSQKLIRW